MMKIRKDEIRSVKLPTRMYESSSWQNSTDTVSLPLDSFTTSSVTGRIQMWVISKFWHSDRGVIFRVGTVREKYLEN